MTDNLVVERTLTLPVGALRTLHAGGCEVRLYRDILTSALSVGKRMDLLGREDNYFVEEAALLHELDHDNITGIIQVAEVSSPGLRLVEIFMPYYELGDLHARLRADGPPLSTGEVRHLFVRALRGLHALHVKYSVLHRDLKPGNLFRDAKTGIRVGDLGEAKRMDEARQAPALITPRLWTPPEAFVGGVHTVASDVYSLGLSLFEALNGPWDDSLFDIDRAQTRLGKGLRVPGDGDLKFRLHVPPPLRRVVSRALRRNPADRYQTAALMREALVQAKFVDWAPVENGETTGTRRAGRYRVTSKKTRAGWRARCEQASGAGWRKITGSPEFDAPGQAEALDAALRHVETHDAKT